MFAVGGPGELGVNKTLVGVGTGVGDEGIDLCRGRRQADQIESDAAGESAAIRLRLGLELGGLETGKDETIDGRAGPVGLLHRRRFGALGGLVGPMLRVGASLRDPAAEQIRFGGRDRLAGLPRGHDVVVVRGEDALQQFALVWITRRERLVPAKVLARSIECVEP